MTAANRPGVLTAHTARLAASRVRRTDDRIDEPDLEPPCRLACASDPKQATIGYQLSVREVVRPAWLPPAAPTLAMADNPGEPRMIRSNTETDFETLNLPLLPSYRTF